MKPRPYHNPENLDESLVPAGWRFLYADEVCATAPCWNIPVIGLRETWPRWGCIWETWYRYPWKHRNRTMIRRVTA
jgi:hypothetical protein